MPTRRQIIIMSAVVAAVTIGGIGIGTLIRLLRYPSSAYAHALGSVRSVCPEVQDFERLFPSSKTYIAYYDGQAGSPEWTGEIKTDLVEIVATMSVSFDSQRRNALRCGPMRIEVLRVKSVEPLPGGRERRTYADQKTYSLEQLQARLKGISDPRLRLEELAR